MSVSHVVNGQTTCTSFLQLWINLASHDVILIVCQNPYFSRIWCWVSFISVAPANTPFTSLASASFSLLGLVYTTAGHVSGLDSQFDALCQISRWSLDGMPLLCSRIPPLSIGCGINLSDSIGHKLFLAPFLSDPIQDYCTFCPSIHRTQTSLHILQKRLLYCLQCWLPCKQK